MQHLQSNDKITWQPAGNGHYVDIPGHSYDQAVAAVGESTGKHDKRGGTPNNGNVEGWSVSKEVCYHSGALSKDNDISQFAVSACDHLVGNALPPLAQNVLRIWQSSQLKDVNGMASYIRYGIKLLGKTPTDIATPSLCQGAIDAFHNYCQDGNGVTAGGELDIGEVVRFSADPTDVATNA